MKILKLLILLLLPLTMYGQTSSGLSSISCPPNIDFEVGNLSSWNCYTGSCCPIVTATPGVVAGRHTITTGAGTDPFGGFPVVSPALGFYSLKLGNSSTGSQAERARYYIQIPPSVTNYSIYYRYAVVLQDPNHTAAEQPRFEVNVYDSTTGNPIACAQRSYVASASLPGFIRSTVQSDVYYLPWTVASLNLSGAAGTTVAVDFASGDCALGGHFGYGYLDISCGLFEISNQECVLGGNTTLSAPPGFKTYTWMNATLTTTIATGQTVSIPTPAITTTYKLILTPYVGFGCPDTLTTIINVSDLAIKPIADTTICRSASVRLLSGVSGGVAPISFEWAPPATLSCTTCDTTIATPTSQTSYTLKVTDATGCFRRDTVTVTPSPFPTFNITNVTCFGLSNGGIATTVVGRAPFTYSWNTSPVATTPGITGLPAATYRLIVKDVDNCVDTEFVNVTEPDLLTVSSTSTNVTCFGFGNGTASSLVAGGTGPFTYNWSNTSPVKTTANITGLVPGIYSVGVTDAHGCTATSNNDTITQPASITCSIASTNVSCNGGSNGTATATGGGGTAPYTFSWNTSPLQTTATAAGLIAGTYTATVKDANGCTVTANITITEPAKIVASIPWTLNVDCNGFSTGKAKTSASGGTGTYTYSWNTTPIQTTDSLLNVPAGTYTVTVTDANLCTGTTTVTITENTPILITPTVTNVTCFGLSNGSISTTVAGGVGPYTYSWNTSPAQTTSGLSGRPAGTYTVTVKDAKGCTATLAVVITQPALLTSSVATVHVSCFGYGNGTATATGAGGTTPYTYSWNTTPTQTTQSIGTLVPGSYTVTITDNQGCTSASTATITQPAPLTSTVVSTPVSCNGGTDGTATVTPAGGTSPYTYSWGSSPVQTTIKAVGLYSGTYPITVTDAKGCAFSNSILVDQPLPLVATATTVKNVSCFGGNDGAITATATGGNGSYNYLWLTISPLNLTANATGLTIGTYGVRVTDAKGCATFLYTTLTQPTVLASGATSTDVTCNGANNGTADVTASGGTTPYTYSWNTTPIKTTANVTGLPPGKYTVTVKDDNGCVSTSIVTIKQPTALAATTTNTNVTCYDGSNANASVTVTGGTTPYTYIWNTTPTATTPAVAGIKKGAYNVSITDANGCTLIKSVNVTEPAKLKGVVKTISGTCPENTTGAADITISGGVIPYKILWSDAASTTTTSIGQLAAGKYGVRVTDSNNCVFTDTLVIVKWPSPKVSLVISDSVICVGKSISLTASGGLKYTWAPLAALSCDTCITNTSLPQSNTTYSVIGYNEYGCGDTAYADIIVIDRAKSSTDPEVKICIGATAQLNAYNGVSYEWSPAATLNRTDISNPIAKPDTTTTYQVIVKENKCYIDTLEQTVSVYPYPEVDAGKDVAGVPGSSMQLQGIAINADKYEWTPGDWLSCNNCLNPIVTPKTTTKYTLKAISPGGCYAIDTVTARIACDGSMAYLPNSFSPNNDGQNDVFYPRGDGFTTIMNFRIIDRWGEVIYKASNFLVNNKQYGWDGNYNSTAAPAGVYIYVLEVGCPNNTTTIVKGDVTLLR